MKHWLAAILSPVLFLALLMVFNGHVSAQTDGAVEVLELSTSGYERANALAFSPDGRFLAVGGTSGIYLFDTQVSSTPEFIRTGTWARSLTFLPQDSSLAAGLYDGTVKVWGLPALQLEKTLDELGGWVRSISISHDGSLLASASDDDRIHIWRTGTDTLALVLNEVAGVRAVALSPDGSLVAGALADNTVRVWKVSNGELLYTLTGHTDWPRCLAFSPDGQTLASGAFDKTIRLWKMGDGRPGQTLEGHTSSVLSIAFSPDGRTLASGSVDHTVLLWDLEENEPRNVLQGHKEFVYAVAFSPDGKTLASGGGDNTVRLWNLNAFQGAPMGQVPPTSSDCRQCHHRRGQNEPARVIDLSCEACHPTGIGLSWCPAFPRSSEVKQLPMQYHATYDVSGVPINNGEISVILASPGNGETFYVMQDFMAPEIISGRVYYGDRETITAVRVQLNIISNGKVTASLETSPTESGDFSFNVAINPEAPPSYSSKPATRQCIICHDDSLAQAGLPIGTVDLRVTATAPDGSQALDERWARIDSSTEVTVPIHVVEEGTTKPLPGLLVEASMILYEWRDRYGSAITDESGDAPLNLEKLSQAVTVYEISIPPQILGGRLYASPQAVTLTVEPDMVIAPAVTLNARALQGQIHGVIDASASLENTAIWAIHLPGGPIYQTTVEEGIFGFEEIPVGRYLLAPDDFALAQKELHTPVQEINLFESPDVRVEFSPQKVSSISGRILAMNGDFLPFAWVELNDQDPIVASDPVSGRYLIHKLESGTSYATVSAPGHYSLSKSMSSLSENPDFSLVPKPETKFFNWGSGMIVLPPEANGSVDGSKLVLEHGWLWGENKGTSQPFQIHVPGMEIHIQNGRFALEYPAGGMGWLYVYEGEAKVIEGGSQALVQSGEMIALMGGAEPFPMESAVALVLHPPLPDLPVFEAIEPSPKAKFQNWLAKAGIGLMQLITFITYILSLVTLTAIIFNALFLRRKRAKSPPVEEKS